MDNFIHIDSAVAAGKTLLPENNSLDDAIARQWCYMALKDIGIGKHWFAECELVPNSNLSVKKPVDLYRAIDISLYNKSVSGNLTEYRYSYKGMGKRIHLSTNPLISNGTYSPQDGAPIDLSEDEYCFHLGSNGSNINLVKLKYWRFPIGSDGLPLIPDEYELAIALFIRYMWAIRDNVANDRALSRQDYLMAKSEARSKAKAPSGIEFEQAAKEWNSLLNSPQFKQF